jgi:hypothetical protein
MNKNEPEQISALKQVVRRSGGQGIMTVPSSGYGYSQMKVPGKKPYIHAKDRPLRLTNPLCM